MFTFTLCYTTKLLHYRDDGAASSSQMCCWGLIACYWYWLGCPLACQFCAVMAFLLSSIPHKKHTCIFGTPILLPALWDMAEDVALISREASMLGKTLHKGWYAPDEAITDGSFDLLQWGLGCNGVLCSAVFQPPPRKPHCVKMTAPAFSRVWVSFSFHLQWTPDHTLRNTLPPPSQAYSLSGKCVLCTYSIYIGRLHKG